MLCQSRYQTFGLLTDFKVLPCSLHRRFGTKSKWRPFLSLTCRTQASKSNLQRANAANEQLPPWLLGFQCNERYLKWDDSAQIQLLKIYAARELGKDIREIEEQLAFLGDILPDLIGKINRMKAGLLLALVRDTEGIARRLIDLKALLPNVNVSRLVAGSPTLLLHADMDSMTKNLEELRAAVGDKADVGRLIERESMLLLADVRGLIAEAERLLPRGQDPVAYLVANPGTLLDMQQAGLPSAIDGNLWTADV